MNRIMSAMAALFLVVLIAAPAAAQVVTQPDAYESPFGSNVSGFLSIKLGLVGLPDFDATASPVSEGLNYRTRQEQAMIPGFSAHLALIPVFGNNGISMETGYEILTLKWKQDVSDNVGTYGGDSTLAFSLASFSVNYLRYFLRGPNRIYLLGGAGYAWASGKLSSETGGDGESSSASFPNWRVNTGLGFVHQMRTGAIGTELRADFPLLDTEMNFDDAKGNFDVSLEHTVIIHLGITFAIGRLVER
ncbi:MAG: hypothetical protein P9L99_04840 [Candidatus Lernaella stagnicola]|nr:hypothetical protein [Candidatus Lernaella stagnicola]